MSNRTVCFPFFNGRYLVFVSLVATCKCPLKVVLFFLVINSREIYYIFQL